MTSLSRVCDHCFEETTPEVSIARVNAGRFSMYPPVTATDGSFGHIECMIAKGIVSIGDRTGPEFLAELNKGRT